MRAPIRLDYRAKPTLLGFMAQMWRPSPGFGTEPALPEIEARWRGQRCSPHELADYRALSGLPPDGELSVLYPHTVSFPMLMAVLSHPAFPLPIWRVLQVRNRLSLHEAIAPDAVLDFTVRGGACRVLEKGIEMDLRVSAECGGRTVFEGLNTFYSRGRFGAAGTPAPASPEVTPEAIAEWRMPDADGWRYGRLSGDFNPLHMHDGYARRFGYPRAFAHPQRVIGQCLGHLDAASHAPMELDTWIKGPVFYGATLGLRAASRPDGGAFALHVDSDPRPAIVGSFSTPHSRKES